MNDKKVRSDAWTDEEDRDLANTIIEYVRTGSTQAKAYEIIADKHNRTVSAVQFRWNNKESGLKEKYKDKVKKAKEAYKAEKKKAEKTKKASSAATTNKPKTVKTVEKVAATENDNKVNQNESFDISIDSKTTSPVETATKDTDMDFIQEEITQEPTFAKPIGIEPVVPSPKEETTTIKTISNNTTERIHKTQLVSMFEEHINFHNNTLAENYQLKSKLSEVASELKKAEDTIAELQAKAKEFENKTGSTNKDLENKISELREQLSQANEELVIWNSYKPLIQDLLKLEPKKE